ncbi:unnamed protein product [Rhodiola kirilowii]
MKPGRNPTTRINRPNYNLNENLHTKTGLSRPASTRRLNAGPQSAHRLEGICHRIKPRYSQSSTSPAALPSDPDLQKTTKINDLRPFLHTIPQRQRAQTLPAPAEDTPTSKPKPIDLGMPTRPKRGREERLEAPRSPENSPLTALTKVAFYRLRKASREKPLSEENFKRWQLGTWVLMFF